MKTKKTKKSNLKFWIDEGWPDKMYSNTKKWREAVAENLKRTKKKGKKNVEDED